MLLQAGSYQLGEVGDLPTPLREVPPPPPVDPPKGGTDHFDPPPMPQNAGFTCFGPDPEYLDVTF